MSSITKIEGVKIEGYHRLAGRANPTHPEKLKKLKGRLAFLDLEDNPKKDKIRERLWEIAHPQSLHLWELDEGKQCCFVFASLEPTAPEIDPFDRLCEYAKTLSDRRENFKKANFYTAEDFFQLNRDEMKRILREAAGLDLQLE